MPSVDKKKILKLNDEVVSVDTFEIFFTRHAEQRIFERCGPFFLENTLNYLRHEKRFVFMKRKNTFFLFVPTGIFLVGIFETPKKFIVKTTLYPSLHEKNEILRSNRLVVEVSEKTIISMKLSKARNEIQLI